MIAPQDQSYSKPVTEIWTAFDCRDRSARSRLQRERRGWASSATTEDLGYGRVVLMVRPGGALKLAR